MGNGIQGFDSLLGHAKYMYFKMVAIASLLGAQVFWTVLNIGVRIKNTGSPGIFPQESPWYRNNAENSI